MDKRLTYQEVHSIEWDRYPDGENHNGWNRRGESKDGKYFYEELLGTGEWHIVESATGKEVYSYYTDFYTG